MIIHNAAVRIDTSPLSIVEPERWRNIARDWYGAGLAEHQTGKLHHDFGLKLMRGFSISTLHPFLTCRDSVVPPWSLTAQTRRSAPDARASELFVLLHGMLLTNIQFDDFQPMLACFIEHLEIEGAEEPKWIMMGVINVSSVLEYGHPNAVGPKEVNGPQVAAATRVMTKKAAANVLASSSTTIVTDAATEDDEEHKGDNPSDHPLALKFALQRTFAILTHVLHCPARKASQYAESNVNPYLSVLLTLRDDPASNHDLLGAHKPLRL
ncbi:hypothetical protein CVT26_003049 [Gymnopilus dilepis]|uniref:Uncharacterized protein n=1 Tax=Gymnopilus dilepis TaxID=231916 RepID=A0A409Y4U0_9AGAR|nr:hypothetical protein CVT26_003049 [Gymnopilus dilepis]